MGQELTFDGIFGSVAGGLIGPRRLGVAAQPSEQVRPDGVEQVVAVEVEPLDHGEGGVKAS